jgi:hypothetical protein
MEQESEIKPGDRVRLRAYGDEVIERVVIEPRGDVIYVCRESERESAAAERRDPLMVGFRRSAVLGPAIA